MKTALLLSGLMHTFQKTSKYILEIADLFDADIFIYTFPNDFYHDDYQIKSETNETYKTDSTRTYTRIKYLNIEESIELLNQLIPETYGEHLKQWSINEFTDYDITEIDDRLKCDILSAKRQAGQWESLRKCYDMMKTYEEENDIQYDFFIRCRPDLKFTTIPDTLCDSYKQNTLFCSGSWNSDRIMRDDSIVFIREEFFMGSRHVFDIITEFNYPYIDLNESSSLLCISDRYYPVFEEKESLIPCKECTEINIINIIVLTDKNICNKCVHCNKQLYDYNLLNCSNNQFRLFLDKNNIIHKTFEKHFEYCILKYYTI